MASLDGTSIASAPRMEMATRMTTVAPACSARRLERRKCAPMCDAQDVASSSSQFRTSNSAMPANVTALSRSMEFPPVNRPWLTMACSVAKSAMGTTVHATTLGSSTLRSVRT